ncbi:hypothetical protein [Yoonia sp.]|uniref:hypothetical protein n=1 Tax=Yoonia sp. TaxID=2212373 RepID=UPI003F6AAD64
MKFELSSFTVIAAHFGDFFWIGNLEKRIRSLSKSDSIQDFRIVDQDRSNKSALFLADLPSKPSVLTFPEDVEQIAQFGHDHAAALNHCMNVDYATSHLIILDSDCFPIKPDWIDMIQRILDAGSDAIVARDPHKSGLSHPCFMVLPIGALHRLDFAEGFMEVGIDTGRLIGFQLQKQGYQVHWDEGKKASSYRSSYFYLERSLYHHGSASFVSSSQKKLSSQVNAVTEEFFRKKVAHGEFDLTLSDKIRLSILKRCTRLFVTS